MAFEYLKSISQSQKKEPTVQVRNPQFDLTLSELEIVLTLLAQCTFPVKDIQALYVALYKLQEQHQALKNERKD